MNLFYLFAGLVALLFPLPTTHLTTTGAAQIVALAPVERVFSTTTVASLPHRAAIRVAVAAAPAVKSTPAVASAPKAQTAAVAVTSTPTPATKPASVVAAPVPTSSAFSALELAIIADINAARVANGVSALTADSKLGSIARGHSADMLSNNYFEHTSTSGCTAVCRYQDAGYRYWSMGENIYWMEGFSLTSADAAQKVVDAWQNSPGHRENDLGKFTRVGVGVAESGSKVYVSADFATPQ